MDSEKVSKLLYLKELYEKGAITAEKLAAEKAKLLGETTQTTSAQPKAESTVELKVEKESDSLKKSKNKGGIIAACIIAALAVVAGVFFFIIRPKENSGSGNTNDSQIAKKEVKQEKKRDPALDQGIRSAFQEHLSAKSYYKDFLRDTRVIDWILYYYGQEYYDKMLKRGNMRTRVKQTTRIAGYDLDPITSTQFILAGAPADMESEDASFIYYDVQRDVVKCGIAIWGLSTNDEGELDTGDWELSYDDSWFGSYSRMIVNNPLGAKLTFVSDGYSVRAYIDGDLVNNQSIMIKRDSDDYSIPLSKYNDYDLLNLFNSGGFMVDYNGFKSYFGDELRGANKIHAKHLELYSN